MKMTPSLAASGSLPSNFGERQTQLPPLKVDPNLGKWEKHTKGIGMKLLAKMEYSGSGGLGAQRKIIDAEGPSKGGISRPVEVVVRPNNFRSWFWQLQGGSQAEG
jgi:hypothetical protein